MAALLLSLITHGVISYFTLPNTYDAFVHIFFADHYARFWFEPWEYRWYTGFFTVSYPPLVHQLTALISYIFPLKVAFAIYANIIMLVLIVGMYRFTKLFFDKITAGYAAILIVIVPSIIETLHVYGQVPTLSGLAWLLNALPFVYHYFTTKSRKYLFLSLAFLAVTICSHHVTVIFGMVFFIAPLIYMALSDANQKVLEGLPFRNYMIRVIRLALSNFKYLFLFGTSVISITVLLILPFWYWSKTDPIAQVSIPHGSRDNFLENTSSGLIFYVIPLLLVMALISAIVWKLMQYRKNIGWTVSFLMCLLLGSGGTTPIPRILLGDNAFNVLTLDRFGFWASIIAIPFLAHFIRSFISGKVSEYWKVRFGKAFHMQLLGLSAFAYFIFLIFTFHLSSFRPLQPRSVEIQPIINFLNRDEHLRWRFMTLGFGDQMAWLSANTLAATVDGNYHSARRLPELTTRPVERLENAKYLGDEGLASLQDFLTKADKYNLKYIFSNDRYYDPLLYYAGWNRASRLENGIMIWEKGNIPTIPPQVSKAFPENLKLCWGIIPVSTVVLVIILTLYYLRNIKTHREEKPFHSKNMSFYPKPVIFISSFTPLIFFSGFLFMEIKNLLFVEKQKDPASTIENFYNELDFQRFEESFRYFKNVPTYTLDQYLLEKSVNEGGLVPSYAKLDSIYVVIEQQNDITAELTAYTTWRTSLGKQLSNEKFLLEKQGKKWYILPPEVSFEIPEYQVRTYTFTLFKKQGKRVISTFPTVKDDRVKKAFARFESVNLRTSKENLYLAGNISNADDFPINIGLKARMVFKNDSIAEFYPSFHLFYNLSPKEKSFFRIDLPGVSDTASIKSLELFAETDLTEKGYIHGGAISFNNKLDCNSEEFTVEFYNELSSDINIPGLLMVKYDEGGYVSDVKTQIFNDAVRSGLHGEFTATFSNSESGAAKRINLPIELFINGTPRENYVPEDDSLHCKLILLPHCFIGQEIFLQ